MTASTTDWKAHTYPTAGVTVWNTHIDDSAVVYYAELEDGSGQAGIFATDDSDALRSKATTTKDAAELLAHRLAERAHRALPAG